MNRLTPISRTYSSVCLPCHCLRLLPPRHSIMAVHPSPGRSDCDIRSCFTSIRPAGHIQFRQGLSMTMMADFFDIFVGFAGLVTLASLWNMWGGDIFPAEKDPTGGTPLLRDYSSQTLTSVCLLDPEYWTETELRRWLKLVSSNMFAESHIYQRDTSVRKGLTTCAARLGARVENDQSRALGSSRSEYAIKDKLMSAHGLRSGPHQ